MRHAVTAEIFPCSQILWAENFEDFDYECVDLMVSSLSRKSHSAYRSCSGEANRYRMLYYVIARSLYKAAMPRYFFTTYPPRLPAYLRRTPFVSVFSLIYRDSKEPCAC